MKTCTKCKITKHDTDFNFKIKERGVLHSHCKNCSRDYVRNHYKHNRQYYLLKAKKRNIATKIIIRNEIWTYLINHPCIDCGENDPVVLEFDHTKDKRMDVSSLVTYGSLKNIIKEIEKCEIRCANCHRRKTAIQYGWHKNMPL